MASSGTFFEKYGMALALFAGLVIIAGAIAFGRPSGAPDTGTGQPTSVNIEEVKTQGNPYVGSPNAPVTMAVWFDFQCGFCKQFEATTLAQLKQEYVESGQVKIVYKDFQFLGQASVDTALYSRAVWEAYPERWEDWFVGVTTGSAGEVTLDLAGLNNVSVGLGMDTARLNALLTENRAEYQAAIEADRNEGMSFGINGTPGSIVGTTLIGGAHPYVATGRAGEQPVKPLIEAELAK